MTHSLWRRPRITFLLNDGREQPSFVAAGIDVEDARPQEVVSADFDRDGRVDLALLALSEALERRVHILFAERSSGEVLVFREVARIDVDANALRLTIADFNPNSFPDDLGLLVNPSGGGTPKVELLLHDRGADFAHPEPVPLPCLNSECIASAFTAADFDRDSFADLVTLLRPTAPDAPTGSLIVLEGRTFVGEYRLGMVLDASAAPGLLAVGRFDADERMDLAVTSETSVQVYINTSPGLPNLGQPCAEDRDCVSGVCEDGLCCEERCNIDERCDVPGFEGTCISLKQNGILCEDGPECLTGFCVDGVCCASPQCPAGESCTPNGQCDESRTPDSTASPIPAGAGSSNDGCSITGRGGTSLANGWILLVLPAALSVGRRFTRARTI
jgi:hypothetical protein